MADGIMRPMLDSADDDGHVLGGRVRSMQRSTAFWVAMLEFGLVAFFTVASPNHVFLDTSNIQSIALDSSQLILLASGTALLLAAGQFDISLGANVILSSVVAAKVMVAIGGGQNAVNTGVYHNFVLAVSASVLAGVITGLVIGTINGLVISYLRVNAFVATLGMLGVATGLGFLVSGGADIGGLPTSIQEDFGIRTVVGIPLPTLCAAAIALLIWHVLHRTRFGVRTIALGSSRDSTLRAGINVLRHQISLYAIIGALAGVAGIIDLARFSTTNLGGHQTDALAAIGAAVIGGASLNGGRASIAGAIVGVALAAILINGLVIVGLPAFYQLIAIGVVLVAAVAIDENRRTRL